MLLHLFQCTPGFINATPPHEILQSTGASPCAPITTIASRRRGHIVWRLWTTGAFPTDTTARLIHLQAVDTLVLDGPLYLLNAACAGISPNHID
jgi:hypothetical protein